MGKKELNPRQKRFAEEYLLCGDAEEAALAAGYSPAAAARTGERLLQDPAVQAYRREAEQRLYEAIGSMLLPQFLQKAKRKNIAKLGKNPAQNQQQNNMKMFTYIMMAMIIFMGFTLPSAMGVYWFFGALFSIAQTLIVEAVTQSRAKKKGK